MKVIALYLPQYHPIPENDQHWGKGFTEWTNVGKSRPLFKGHYQPRVPADLGYYDLRLPEIRFQQAELAKEAGISGFCYYHYWFGNKKQLLEKPFNEVLATGEPDFPFCLCWANHTWSNKTWEKQSQFTKDTIIAEQKYGGIKDYTEHFYSVLAAFNDRRYMTIEEKPIFMIYDPYNFKDVTFFMELWRNLAVQNGLRGIYFIGMTSSTLSFRIDGDGSRHAVLPNLKSSSNIYNYILSLGFDAVNSFGKRRGELLSSGIMHGLYMRFLKKSKLIHHVETFDYQEIITNFFAPEDSWENVYPTLFPQWDRSPRVGKADGVYVNSSPDAFYRHVLRAKKIIEKKSERNQIAILKSWNEWGEGNYIEPDLRYGKQYIEALHRALNAD